MNKFFEVNAKCGHVGKRKCVNISFPVAAENAKEAAKKCREFKRVKHHHKYAINYVKELTLEEFIELKEIVYNDEYLHCKNIQEQNRIEDFYSRVVEDDYIIQKLELKEEQEINRRNERIEIKRQKYNILKREFFNQIQELYI